MEARCAKLESNLSGNKYPSIDFYRKQEIEQTRQVIEGALENENEGEIVETLMGLLIEKEKDLTAMENDPNNAGGHTQYIGQDIPWLS